jgi:DUF971 family protein
MSLEVIPTSIERTEQGGIRIHWSDLTDVEWSPGELRKACPCATCKEKAKADTNKQAGGLLQVIPLREAVPIAIESMQPVGNYAYNVRFSDGHSSGIFGFDLLRKVGEH